MRCPYCAEEIQDDARKCRHCGEWLEASETSSPHIEVRREPLPIEQPAHRCRGRLTWAFVALVVGVLVVATAIWVVTADRRLSGPERVWQSYTRAAAAGDGDLAVSYWDYAERQRQWDADNPPTPGSKADPTSPNYDRALMEPLKREERDLTEEATRLSINTGIVRDYSAWEGPTRIENDGLTATVYFQVDGKELSVDMKMIDGDWKIINLNDVDGSRPN